MSKDVDRYLRTSAWYFLLRQGIDALPVDPLPLIARNGWNAYTYSAFSQRTGLPVSQIKERYAPTSFACWHEPDAQFVIGYDTANPPETLRWQMMVSVGLIVLGHITRETPILSNRSEPEKKHALFEGNSFARRVLCPSIVMHECGAFTPEAIMRLCGISHRAAERRSEYMAVLETRGAYRTDPMETEVERQFRKFIEDWNRNMERANRE